MGYEFIHGANAGASSPAMAGALAPDAAKQYLDQLAFYVRSPHIGEAQIRRSLAIRALWLLCRSIEPNKGVLEGCELFLVHEAYWVFQEIVFHRAGWWLPPGGSPWRNVQLPFVVMRKPMQLVLVRSRRIGTPSPIETVVKYANYLLVHTGTCSIDGGPDLPEKPPPMI